MWVKKNQNTWSLFFSEIGIGYVLQSRDVDKVPHFGFLPLEAGVIEKGYIKDPWLVRSKLKELQKTFAFKNGNVRIVIGEENILFKRITIDKSLLKTFSISEYIHDQLGKTIHFPYSSPELDFHIYSETETSIGVLLFIFDKNLLHDYADLFESIGVRKIEFDLSYLATYRMYCHKMAKIGNANLDDERYLEGYFPDAKGIMLVSIHKNILTIGIFDQEIPVFTMLEELEGPRILDLVVHYIERIANYYQYNINKGMQKVSHIELFNYCENLQEESMKKELIQKLKDYEVAFFDFSLFSLETELRHKGCYLAYAASLKGGE